MSRHQKNQQVHLKIKLFNYALVILFAALVLYPFSYIFAALSCSVTTAAACTGGNVVILRMSGSTNAHAELPSQSNVNYDSNVVCCSSISSLGNSCSGNFITVGRLSGVTNAHAQQTSVNTYGSDICLSDSSVGDTITMGYQNTNCSGYDTTLFSMTGSDNATVGDGSAYTTKVCATIVAQTITFDLDTATSDINTNAPYAVSLGGLTTTQASNSDNASIKSIWVDLDTNASSGAVIAVASSNGALKSTSTPADTIPSATATMAAGTANYGLCVDSVTQTSGGTLTEASPFDGATCTSSHNNTVGAVTTSNQNILTVSSPIVGGRSEIRVNAENSATTPAHDDYADTLTFTATGTF